MPPESEVDILLCAPLEVIQVVIKMEAVPLCTCAACLMDGEPHAGSFGVCVCDLVSTPAFVCTGEVWREGPWRSCRRVGGYRPLRLNGDLQQQSCVRLWLGWPLHKVYVSLAFPPNRQPTCAALAFSPI